MKKLIIVPFVCLILVFIIAACKKDSGSKCTNNTLEQDRHVIDSFITASGQTNLTWQTQGFYSALLDPGTGSAPKSDSIVSYKFVRKLLNGNVVDSMTVPSILQPQTYKMSDYANAPVEYFMLSNLKEGGRMRVIIPSLYGFGCGGAVNTQTGQQVVPPNAQLVYDFTLLDVKQQ